MFKNLHVLIQRENQFEATQLWVASPKGPRFQPNEAVIRDIRARISGVSSECLGGYIGTCQIEPTRLTRTMRSCDYKSFRTMLCELALQVVLMNLRTQISAPVEFA